MLSLIEPQLAELLLHGLRDLAADVFPRAAAVGVTLMIGAVLFLRARRATRRGRRPQRPLPATA